MNYLQTDFSNICRTCLIQSSTMKSVFNYVQLIEQKILLSDMLMACAPVVVIQGDGLPENICVNCSEQINRAYLFRKLCERSDSTLRECATIPSTNDEKNIYTAYTENKFDIGLQENSLNEQIQNEFRQHSSGHSEHFNKAIGDNFLHNSQEYSNDSCYGEALLNLNDDFSTEPLDTNMSGIPETNFKCKLCNKVFNLESQLSRHMLMHERKLETRRCRNKTGIIKKRNQTRTCNICNKTFQFHSNLERHKLTHTGEKPYLCNVCGKGFAQMAYLKIHSFIHTGEKPYKCKMCGGSFTAPGTLSSHLRTHTGERPYICKICGKDFTQSGYLAAHIRTHTGEKPVECKLCNRKFNQGGRLLVHMRVHSGEKPYQCEMCKRSFAIKGTLKKHMRTHTGEKPYKCNVCGQVFAQNATLSTHMKVHKQKIIVEDLISCT